MAKVIVGKVCMIFHSGVENSNFDYVREGTSNKLELEQEIMCGLLLVNIKDESSKVYTNSYNGNDLVATLYEPEMLSLALPYEVNRNGKYIDVTFYNRT